MSVATQSTELRAMRFIPSDFPPFALFGFEEGPLRVAVCPDFHGYADVTVGVKLPGSASIDAIFDIFDATLQFMTLSEHFPARYLREIHEISDRLQSRMDAAVAARSQRETAHAN